MIEGQARGDIRPPIVANDREPPVTELLHQADHVARHRTL
jgi:hypothetical protein